MVANDLNKSSDEQMNLNSGESTENMQNDNKNPSPENEVEESKSGNKEDKEQTFPENQEEQSTENGESDTEQSEIPDKESREPESSVDPAAGEASEVTEEAVTEEEPSDEATNQDDAKEAEAYQDNEENDSDEENEPEATDEEDAIEKDESEEDDVADSEEGKDEIKSEESRQDVDSDKKDKSSDLGKKGSDAEKNHPEEVDYSTLSREELLKHYHKLMNEFPASAIKGHVEAIRKEFERKSAAELTRMREEFIASGEPAEAFTPPHDDLSDAMQEAIQAFRKKRDEERAQIEEEKKKNLAAKYEVIEGIKDLVNRQESLHHTFDEFRALQQRWREIGPVPQKEVHDMWENYHLHVENFYNYIKINKELRDLDLKKNYEAKLGLCEKAEKLLLEPSIVKAFKTLQKYHDQWREIGPVPKEKKEELWERFREATVKINQKHQEYFENLKEEQQKNLEAKKELCEKVEAILEKDLKSPKEWENHSKTIIEIQRLWKTIGFAPKKDNQEIYLRFRAACDRFFDAKREYFRRYKEEQQNNLQLKNELVQQAEALKDSTDWKNTTEELIRIQKRWKEIGPVPRKHSDAIWKKFRGACDHFFNRKAEFFSKKDEAQEQNLKLKEELIEELRQYEPGKNNEESFRVLQDFQRRWSEIGFVPIKEKDRVNQEFRNLINARFDHLNMDETTKALQKFRNKLENWKLEGQFEDRINQERNKIIGKLKQLENDIILWENNIGFFTKSKNSEALVRDFKNKIENGKRNITLLNKKLDLIEEMENEQ
jgi:hypothetical protein